MKFQHFCLAVAFLASFSACTVIEAASPNDVGEYVEATFAVDDIARTSLDGGRVLWHEGDAVKVHYSNSGNDYKFTAVADSQGNVVYFQGMIKSSDQSNAIEGVMYPYTDISSFWWIYWSHVQVPSEQTYFEGSFAPGVNPSLGKVKNGRATFYNVAGLISMHVSGDVSLSRIRLSSVAGEALSGMYKFNVSSGISLDSTESELSVVNLTVEDSPVDVSSGRDFVFVVSPASLSKGLKVTFYNDSGESFTSTCSTPFSVGRAKKANLGEFVLSSADFKATAPSVGNLLANGDFSKEVPSVKYGYPVDREWRYSEGWANAGGITKLYWDPAAGLNGSACVVIDSPDNYCDTGFSQVVTGLEADAPYVFTCMVRTEDVAEESQGGYGSSGANLAVVIDDATWPVKSEAQHGSSDWHEVRVEFEPVSETVILRLKLGGTASDGKGRVWFDNAALLYNYGMYIRRSEHVRVLVENEYFENSVITDDGIDTWLSNLDRIYEQYKKLFNGRVPFDGKFVTLRSATINAWAYAGNPVQWNRHYITSSFNAIARGDWSFGLMHELGHNFAPYISDATYAWNFNEELFANFRMFYAIDHIGEDATVINNAGSWNEKTYHGREITGLYYSDTDNCYLKTLAKGRAVEMGNALTWCFVRMVDEFGWKLWEDTFDELYRIPEDAIDTTGWTQWDKFQCLISYLNKHVPEGRDVRETFPEGELAIIEEYLKTQK